MNRDEKVFRAIGWALAAVITAIIVVIILGTFNIGCVDLGFYKSCGVSVIR